MSQRHHEVTRIEGFSDLVFGFALALLVVSLEAPKHFSELQDLLRGSVMFGLMFALVSYIWWEHNKFFRRYGLQDAWTATLNAFLLFVVLFYVYPLKYLTTSLLGNLFHLPPAESMFVEGRAWKVMVIYSAGVTLIFGTFVLLYMHAWRKRSALELSQAEELTLRFGMRAHVYSASLGVLSILITLLAPSSLVGVAGLIYGLMGPIHAWNGYGLGKALAGLEPLAASPKPIP